MTRYLSQQVWKLNWRKKQTNSLKNCLSP
jgi:hypothetical protein